MELTLEFDLEKAAEKFKYMPKDMNPVLARAINAFCRKVQSAARDKENHRYVSRTGRLERSGVNTMDAKPEKLEGSVFLDNEAVVNEKGAHYAAYVHEGTKPHDIFPKEKKMLKFATSKNTARWRSVPYGRFQKGRFTFAFGVSHPGTKPDPFLYNAAEREKGTAQAVFERAVADFLRKNGRG